MQAEVAAGEATLTEEDEDGQVIYDAGEHMGEMMSQTETVLKLIREAFTIALHQFWERQTVRFMREKKVRATDGKLVDKQYDQDRAVAFLKARGFEPKADQLNALRLAANVAKHGAGDSAEKLFEVRPDLFDREGMAATEVTEPAYDYLLISDAVLESFFLAVKQTCTPSKA